MKFVPFYLTLQIPGVLGLASSSAKKSSSGTGFGASKTAWKKHTTDESVRPLLDWLVSCGADVSRTEIGTYEGRRGLFAVKKIDKEKIICRIPSDAALALSDPSKPVDNVVQNAVFFLRQYWNQPQWKVYLDTLPRDVDETPNYFESDEIDLLEWPSLRTAARNRQDEIQALAEAEKLDNDLLRYATWLVTSRSFPILLSQDENLGTEEEVFRDKRGQVIAAAGGDRPRLNVMVPYLDMVNHNAMPNARLTLIDPEKDDAWFALQALRPIAPGKEICLAYGNGLNSAELLLNYGFVSSPNPIDKLVIQKRGEGIIDHLDGWTTALDEDKAMLAMGVDSQRLEMILRFRIQMKESYP
jgi:hypothetical protein